MRLVARACVVNPPKSLISGKEKAHKHKQISPVIAQAGGGLPTGWGGGLPTGGQGSKVYVLCAEPKEHKRFRPGTRPGGIGFPAGRIGDRGDREIVNVPNVYVPLYKLFGCTPKGSYNNTPFQEGGSAKGGFSDSENRRVKNYQCQY